MESPDSWMRGKWGYVVNLDEYVNQTPYISRPFPTETQLGKTFYLTVNGIPYPMMEVKAPFGEMNHPRPLKYSWRYRLKKETEKYCKPFLQLYMVHRHYWADLCFKNAALKSRTEFRIKI